MAETESTQSRIYVDCPTCGSDMSPRAQLCPTCKFYKQGWRNWLSFWGSGAGIFAVIISALTFVYGQVEGFYRWRFGVEKVELMYFEYPGEIVIRNVGYGDVIVDSIVINWDNSPEIKPIRVPVRTLIKAGEIAIVPTKSLYPEPYEIKSASWFLGTLTEALVRDSFDFGNQNRCSVFHVFNESHAAFKIIGRNQGLPIFPASAQLVVYHLRTRQQINVPMEDINTAFLVINNNQCNEVINRPE